MVSGCRRLRNQDIDREGALGSDHRGGKLSFRIPIKDQPNRVDCAVGNAVGIGGRSGRTADIPAPLDADHCAGWPFLGSQGQCRHGLGEWLQVAGISRLIGAERTHGCYQKTTQQCQHQYSGTTGRCPAGPGRHPDDRPNRAESHVDAELGSVGLGPVELRSSVGLAGTSVLLLLRRRVSPEVWKMRLS